MTLCQNPCANSAQANKGETPTSLLEEQLQRK